MTPFASRSPAEAGSSPLDEAEERKALITTEMRDDALALAERVWRESRPVIEPLRAPVLTWHLAHCVGRSDEHAIEFLKERKVEAYYPRMRELRPVPRDKMSKKQRALGVGLTKPRLIAFLPRYLFVRFDAGREGWHEIFEFAGIGGLVRKGEMPLEVPDQMVANMRAREIDGAIPGKTPAKLIFNVDQPVRITDGPFADFRGIVERLPDVPIEEIDADMRIRVAVDIFGRSTPVDLTLGQIEKL